MLSAARTLRYSEQCVPPRAAVDQLRQRVTSTLRCLPVLQTLRERINGALRSYSDRDQGFELDRNVELCTGCVPVEASHLMCHQALGDRLQNQVLGRQPQAVLAVGERLTRLVERAGRSDNEYGRRLRPRLIAVGQCVEDPLERVVPALSCDVAGRLGVAP